MVERVQLRYFIQGLQIGLASVKEAYLLYPEPSLLLTEVYRGKSVYRAKGSGKRISYERVKQGLRKTTKVLVFNVPDWLFKPSHTVP